MKLSNKQNKGNQWNKDDFIFLNNTIVSLSEQGIKKSKTNHNLTLPGFTDEGEKVKYITLFAFAGFDFKTVDFSNCKNLCYIDKYAFANNKIERIDLTDTLIKKIDDEVFLKNPIKEYLI